MKCVRNYVVSVRLRFHCQNRETHDETVRLYRYALFTFCGLKHNYTCICPVNKEFTHHDPDKSSPYEEMFLFNLSTSQLSAGLKQEQIAPQTTKKYYNNVNRLILTFFLVTSCLSSYLKVCALQLWTQQLLPLLNFSTT